MPAQWANRTPKFHLSALAKVDYQKSIHNISYLEQAYLTQDVFRNMIFPTFLSCSVHSWYIPAYSYLFAWTENHQGGRLYDDDKNDDSQL